MDARQIDRTARYWSEHTSTVGGRTLGVSWWEAGPAIQNHISQCISGSPDVDWVQYTLQKYLAGRLPAQRMLSLGCGTGGLERTLARHDAFLCCDAYDVADASLREAERLADEEGYTRIHYVQGDVNTIALPQSTYDAVWANASMHHFAALEHVCEQICGSLKHGGLFVLNEYIGPSRFQFPERQKEVANLVLQLLPHRYRQLVSEQLVLDSSRTLRSKGLAWGVRRFIDKVHDRDLVGAIRRKRDVRKAASRGVAIEKQTVLFPTVRDVVSVDPSEAIRSEDIVPVVERYFDIIERRDWGGNIIQYLLAGIAGNFDGDEESEALLHMITTIEDALISAGELKSDFAYIVARPKPTEPA